MPSFQDLPVLAFDNQGAFERWLARHHQEPGGIAIKFAKKGSGVPSITYPEALDVALCFGWIDGQVKSLDDRFYLQRFTPRRPRSLWSKRNIQKVAALIAAGKMRPAGLVEVEAAKADGRWSQAYDSPSTSQVPPDLAAALAAAPQALRFFDELDGTNRYAILHRIQITARPDIRARRISALVDMLQRGETLHPRRGSTKRASNTSTPASRSLQGTQRKTRKPRQSD